MIATPCTLEDEHDIKRHYEAGWSLNNLGKKYHMANGRLRAILVKHDVTIRASIAPRPTKEQRKQCDIDEKVFDELNEQSLYWLGFILADGNISCDPSQYSYCLQVGLAKQDLSHLYKLQAFLASSHKLTKRERKQGEAYSMTTIYSLNIKNKYLAEKLTSLGICPRKSLTATINPLFEESRDFWRGMLDGDGSIYISTTNAAHLGLCGTKSCVDSFIAFVNRKILKTEAHSVTSTQKLWHVDFAHRQAREIAKYLYSDATLCLKRKKLIVDQFQFCVARKPTLIENYFSQHTKEDFLPRAETSLKRD